MFLGITGPLYLSGIIVLAASSISLSLIAFKLFDKEPPKLPIKHEHFYVFSASLSLLMLVLSMSVFFHTKFGINITDKNMGVGMIGEFFAVGISLFGGLMSLRKKKVSFEEEGNLDPLIDLKVQDRVQHTLEEEKNESIQDPQQERISVFENEDSITNEIK